KARRHVPTGAARCRRLLGRLQSSRRRRGLRRFPGAGAAPQAGRKGRAASVRVVQARDGMGQPDDAFHRQHKADAVAGLVEVNGRVDGVQDAVGPLLGDEDHDDVLFGLDGDVENLLLLMDPRAASVDDGRPLGPGAARGFQDILRLARLHDDDDQVELCVGQRSSLSFCAPSTPGSARRKSTPSTSTASTGARPTSATSPKPAMTGSAPGIARAAPRATAAMKVTVMGPVATPPESKAMDVKAGLTRNMRAKASAYPGVRMASRCRPSHTRSMAKATAAPTPTASANNSSRSGMVPPETRATSCVCTRTVGSAKMVTRPSINPIGTSIQGFEAATSRPMAWPAGMKPIRTPYRNSMVPSAVKRRPVKKERDWVRGSCRNLRLKTSATAARGVTASATSMTTSMKALKNSP